MSTSQDSSGSRSSSSSSPLLGSVGRDSSYHAAIHCVVLRLGRHFGFQLFNQDTRTLQGKDDKATPSWTPATIFLATDHLQHLLVKNYMRRDKAPGTDDDKFERAIRRLHGGIFKSYYDWCRHVRLPFRLPQLVYDEVNNSRGGNVLEWEYLLEELSLYFLIYSESANIRHMPEALWFIFWIVRNSEQRFGEVTGLACTHSASAYTWMKQDAYAGVMRKQQHLRNKYYKEIASIRQSLGVKPDGEHRSIQEIQELRKEAADRLWPLFKKPCLELELTVNMVAYGDSGAFLDRIIEPMFNYLSVQVQLLGEKGRDIQWRVAYDDANESLCSRENVMRVMSKLGIKFNERKKQIQFKRDPYEYLLNIGNLEVGIFDGNDQQPVAPPQLLGWNREKAEAFWAREVFGKTFVERRSWLTMYRAFFRVWLFLILEFQTMCIFLWCWDNNAYRWYWLTTIPATHAVASLGYECAGAWTQRSTTRGSKEYPIRILGNPFLRHHALGVFLWMLIVAVMVLAFVAQWLDFFAGITVWWYVAGGYSGLAVAHAILTQRDGYTVSLNSSIAHIFRSCGLACFAWPLEWFGSVSSRYPGEHYLAPYAMSVGWMNWASNAIFWVLVLAAKCAFDWFAVMQPMKWAVVALWDANWLGSVGWTQVPNEDPDLPPKWVANETGFDLDILLCIARVLPGFLVMMNNTQVFYLVIGAVVGALKGLLQLNLGSITSFQEVVLAFHKAPEFWWKRCTSTSAKENIKRAVESATSPSGSRFTPKGDASTAALLSEQVLVATTSLAAGMRRSKSAGRRLHLSDTQLPIWLVFADVWNGIVDELRLMDLISNAEAANLRFVHITLDETTAVVPGMRPIMLPVFFYGGQVTRALESGGAAGSDPTQTVVLAEIRSLLVYILCQTEILTPEQADIAASFTPVRTTISVSHKAKRSSGVDRVVTVMKSLQAIMAPCPDQAAEMTRNDRIIGLRVELLQLVDLVEEEVKAVLDIHRRPARGPAEKNDSRLMHTKAANMKQVLARLKETLLEESGWREFWGENGGLSGIFAESGESTPKSNVAATVKHLQKMLTTSARGAQPRGEEAQRVLSFFMGSLKNPTLETPPPVDEMLSWTVLTPHYQEDVLYALNKKAVGEHFGLGGAQGISDLMSENEDGVTVMAWLRSNYPMEWANLMERLTPALKAANLDGNLVNEADFDEGGPLASERMHLLHWASYRGQLLSRTVKGMMAYEHALRLLARIENPNIGHSPLKYNATIEDLVKSKFSYVVASQKYGDLRRSASASERWLARGVEYMLHQNPGLRVAFLDTTVSSSGRRVQHSVLIRAALGIPVEDVMCTSEMYRIRLPINYLPGSAGGRGVILGEGKPENQNASIIYCFGECMQAIDMNQDNYLCEALKMRNLIAEFNPPHWKAVDLSVARAPGARRRCGVDSVALPISDSVAAAAYQSSSSFKAGGGGAAAAAAPPFRQGEIAFERPWPDPQNGAVALVGFREWIFSQDSGALASFAAATEFTFGSMIQRIMTWPGGVRFHYGHPDLWNKLFVMTRGGVSKATRGFHISEDVFAGYNHVVRGGRVKFKEFISVGKGRDMGFDSINSFESKVSGGNGEQVMSRDVYRLGTHFDFFRLWSFYHSGPGFFINSYLVLLSVYANLWMLTLLALTDTQTLPDPNDDLQTISTLTGQATSVAVQQIVQIGMFSIITYALEMVLEYGLVKAVATLFVQILQGSLAFFVFRSRTTAYFFLSDVQYGGAKYIPTGRGYQLKHNSFVKVYSNYARSHLYYAAELLLLLILLALLSPDRYPATTWSTWLVCVSIFWAPFWFNPGTFLLEKTMEDFDGWLLWMGDVVDPDTKTTWDSWNKQQLEKARNDRKTQTNPLATTLRGILGAVPTAVLTLGAITNLEETSWNRWIVFGVISGVWWFALGFLLLVYRWLMAGRRVRLWRLIRTTTILCIIAFLVCAIIFIPNAASGIGLRNIVLIIFANFSFATVVTQSLLFVFPQYLPLRNTVDASYRILDYVLGYFLFFFLFFLSLIPRLLDWLQSSLLYNIKFSRKLEEARMMGSTSYMTKYVDRATERINNQVKSEISRLDRRGTSSEALKQA